MGRTAMCTDPSYLLHVCSRKIHTCWCAGCAPVASCWYLGYSILFHAGQRRTPCSLSRVQWTHLGCVGDRGSSIVVQSPVWSPVRSVVRAHHASRLGHVDRVGPVAHDQFEWFHHRIVVYCSSRLFHFHRLVLIVVVVLPTHCSANYSSAPSSVVMGHIRVEGWVGL